jgi:2-polyprenyl-3-methyl-5-hydroxy-6-metoxy-1,4-benzoquinol methylase
MEKHYPSYNLSYERFTPEWFDSANQKTIDQFLNENSESLINFCKSYFSNQNIDLYNLQDKKILVTGAGLGGLCHFFAKLGANVTGIDIASLAVIGAKEIARNKNLTIEFLTMDLTQGENLPHKFDYIVDDHLLHCLTDNSDRHNYLAWVKNHLNSQGLFLLESMTFHSKMQIPVGYYLDENAILWQQKSTEDVMYRKLSTTIEIEQEIISTGFKINYLYYHSELAFQIYPDLTRINFEHLPRSLRISATNA